MRHTPTVGRMEGEVAVVTGATAGIGEAIATRFAQEGAHVVVTGRDATRGEAVARACNGVFIAADLAEPDAADRIVAAALARFGAITVLVNNAAASAGDGPVADLDDERWRAILEVDL